MASDVAALVRHTDQVVHLDDHEMAVLHADSFRTFTLDARPTDKAPATTEVTATAFDLGGHEHYMHKEMHEQPATVAQTLRGRLDRRFATAHLGGLDLSARDLLGVRRVKILGCGSAYYAGLAGALLVEGLSRLPADAETASEFRYRNPVIDPETLYVAVSQSGETFDTLAAVQEVKRKGGDVIGVVNAPGSTIAGECGSGVYIHAGPEVSVTSTKSYTSTVVAFALLALHLGRVRDLGPGDGARLIDGLDALPDHIAAVLAGEEAIAAVARELVAPAASMFFVGRVGGHTVALEGAQKLKEVSYVHAEAYPAAELKHGPLALVGPDVPTVVVLPDDHLLEKNLSSVEEIRARRGPVDRGDRRRPPAGSPTTTASPPCCGCRGPSPSWRRSLLGVPLQLLAYHAAVALGPRRRPAPQPGQERHGRVRRSISAAVPGAVRGETVRSAAAGEAHVRRGLVGGAQPEHGHAPGLGLEVRRLLPGQRVVGDDDGRATLRRRRVGGPDRPDPAVDQHAALERARARRSKRRSSSDPKRLRSANDRSALSYSGRNRTGASTSGSGRRPSGTS